MAKTPSTMSPLGTKAPGFNLTDTVSGNKISMNAIKGEVATVVIFICNHCPFVLHINDELVRLGKHYGNKQVSFVAISANDVVTHPGDAPEKMKETAEKLKYPFPYLYDETQEVAKAFDAACTPDFFIYDSELKLAYRGQLDDSRPGNDIPVTGKDIRHALGRMISKFPVPAEQRPSIGCNIKWKS